MPDTEPNDLHILSGICIYLIYSSQSCEIDYTSLQMRKTCPKSLGNSAKIHPIANNSEVYKKLPRHLRFPLVIEL